MPFDPSRYSAPELVNLPDRRWPSRALDRPPIWCSVDLRDGNQALPDPMGHERKSALLALLLRVGFRQIELGFPSASQTDFDFIRKVVEERMLPEHVTPQVITQAREPLIVRTLESIAGASHAIVHLYNSTSELQRRVVFGKSKREILELAVEGARLVKREALRHPETRVTLQYSPESFTGTELDYAFEVCEAVIDAWDPTQEQPMILNLPTTVETTTPNVFADRVEWFHRQLRRRSSVILSVHTHNDRGTGVASAELGLLAGADRVEGTLLGNGERSGNVDIVTLALNLYSHGIDPGLVFDDLPELVRVVTACTRLPVHPRHPYAGELVFTAFSGSHQDAIRKGMHAMERSDSSRYEVPYLPIDPADVGRAYERVIRINSQSGKGGVWHVLEREHGYRMPKDLAIEVGGEVQAVTDARGEELSSADVLALFERRFVDVREPFALENARVEPRADGQGCTVAAHIATPSGACNVIGAGNGPLEAFASAIGSLVGAELDLADRSEQSHGQGAHARTVVYVALACCGKTTYGVGRDEDRSTASFRAILSAANRRAHDGEHSKGVRFAVEGCSA